MFVPNAAEVSDGKQSRWHKPLENVLRPPTATIPGTKRVKPVQQILLATDLRGEFVCLDIRMSPRFTILLSESEVIANVTI